MKFERRLSILAALVALCIAQSSFAEVHFKTLSFAEAKKLAVKEKKKVMVDFYTDWCSWCKVLDRKTYSDEKVGTIADAKFVSLKIDAEKGEGVALAKQYQITGYPTIIFFDADGKEVDRVVGYQDAEKFARSLNLASAGGTKAVLKEIEGSKESTDATKWLIAGNYYADHGEVEKAVAAFRKATNLDNDNKLKAREEAMYGIAFMTEGDHQFDALEQAFTSYPQREEGSQAAILLIKHALESPDPSKATGYVDLWLQNHPQDANVANYFAWTAAEKDILLEKADEYSMRAMSTPGEPSERANLLDTRAAVVAKLGRPQEAVALEMQALDLLRGSNLQNSKLYKEIEKSRDKYSTQVESATPNAVVPAPSPR